MIAKPALRLGMFRPDVRTIPPIVCVSFRLPCLLYLVCTLLQLPDRSLATEWTVTTADDGGPGSLRASVADAVAGDSIVFAPGMNGQTIRLSGGPLVLEKDLVIDASALAGGVALSGRADADGVAEAGEYRVIQTVAGCTLTLRGLVMVDGQAPATADETNSRGGGVYNLANLTLDRCKIRRCQAMSGGGIYNLGSLTLNDCTFDENKASLHGGGLTNDALGQVVVNGSTFSRNTAGKSGSSHAYESTGGGFRNDGEMQMNQCTVALNSSRTGGGFYTGSAGTLVMLQSTVSANQADGGGSGGFNSGITSLRRSIVADNLGMNSNNLEPTFSNNGGNLVSAQASLRQLGSYGGITETMPPLWLYSAAVNAGGSSDIGFTTDQRGRPRLVGSQVDIGAVEFEQRVDTDVGLFVFGSAVFSVPEGQTAQVRVLRIGGALGAASVQVHSSILQGTASAQDFQAVSGLRLEFQHGQTEASFPITTFSDPELKEPNETFTLTLSSAIGAEIGQEPNPCIVRIIDTVDKAKPTLKLIQPRSNHVRSLNDGPRQMVHGTAADNQGIERVEVRLNGADWQPTELYHAEGLKSCAFHHEVIMDPGPNVLEVRAVDTLGLLSAVTRVIGRYDYPQQLYVDVSGPPGSGTVSGGFSPTSTRLLGQTYTITASARPGFVFNGWTVRSNSGPEQIVTSQFQTKYTFIMDYAMTLTARFLANPFGLGVHGGFIGLVRPAEGIAAGIGNLGMISVNVTSKGGISGGMFLDGTRYSFQGILDNQGQARISAADGEPLLIKRPAAKGGDLSLSMMLNLDQNPLNITGQVRNAAGDLLSSFTAARTHYSRANPVPLLLAGTKGQRYHFILPTKPQEPALAPNLYPQGTGIGFLTLKPDGTASGAFVLADGTKFTTSSALSKNHGCPLFASLYQKKGLFAASIQIDTSQTHTDATATDAYWFRPADLKAIGYRDGWPQGLILDALGSQFTVPAANAVQSVFPQLRETQPGAANASLNFRQGRLVDMVDKTLRIDPADKVSLVPTTDKSFTAQLTKTTGEWKGVFTHSDGKKPAWQAIIFQKADSMHQGAHGFFMSLPTMPADGLTESGGVLILAD